MGKAQTLKNIIRLALRVSILMALTFGFAGTVYWPEAWTLFLIYGIFAAYMINWMRKNSPQLLDERMKGLVQKEQPTWDKIWMVVFILMGCLWFASMGLDYRYGWSAVPLELKAIGFVGFLLGLYVIGTVMKINAFLAPEVKVQKKQKVITTGPYKFVRHPHYAGTNVFTLCASLAVGSYYSFMLALLIAVHFAVRIHFEEKKLAKELKGYKEYMKKTKYRLIPYVW